MSETYSTIKLKKNTFAEFARHYHDHQKPNNGEYIIFFAIKNNIKISVYRSNKDVDYYKVTFVGPNLEDELNIWSKSYVVNHSKQKQKAQVTQGFIDYGPQYGSDEVGFGDFFGPLVVVATYLDQQHFRDFNDLIADSKTLSDDFIRQHVPLYLDRVTHKVSIVDNDKFNELTNKGYNMNKIKAMLHLHVLSRLKLEVGRDTVSYIDQFCSEENFKKYTEGMKAIQPLVMKEKGESLFPSTALASVLARYYFLKEMAKINQKYHTQIPLGASTRVDEFAREFKEKHGMTALNKIVKKNFANYRRLDA